MDKMTRTILMIELRKELSWVRYDELGLRNLEPLRAEIDSFFRRADEKEKSKK